MRCRIMKEKAASVGERIRSVSNPILYFFSPVDPLTGVIDPGSQENGVRTAIEQIYTYLPRAGRDRRTLPK